MQVVSTRNKVQCGLQVKGSRLRGGSVGRLGQYGPSSHPSQHQTSLEGRFLRALVHRGLLADPSGGASRRVLEKADADAGNSGKGYIFGSLVVLGAAEMRRNTGFDMHRGEEAYFFKEQGEEDEEWTAQGLMNRRFVLKRRAVPNGQRLPWGPHMQSTITERDYATDIFRLGRQAPLPVHMRGVGSVCNDVVIRGPQTASGAPLMPRFACLIVVDRKPPFTLRVYAGDGSSDRGRGTTSSSSSSSSSSSPATRYELQHGRGTDETVSVEEGEVEEGGAVYDTTDRYAHPLLRGGATSSSSSSHSAPRAGTGVRLWRPDSRVWMNVSSLGWTFESYSSSSSSSTSSSRYDQKISGRLLGYPSDRDNSCSNELVDGAILDVYGVLLSFSSAASMERYQPKQSPGELMGLLNSRHPTCPVLYHSISFTFSGPKKRALNEYVRLKQEHINRSQCNGANGHLRGATPLPQPLLGGAATAPFTVPHSDPLDAQSDKRAMVFPACGHVFGFHKALCGQACPMCRTTGPYKSLLFAFEPALQGPVQHPGHPEDALPTHVFNPCGHTASLSTCQRWASTMFMPDSLRCHPGSHLLHTPRRHGQRVGRGGGSGGSHCVCPYCACVLDPQKPFTRLVMNTDNEQGEQGKSDVDDDEECRGRSDSIDSGPSAYSQLLQGRPMEYPKVPRPSHHHQG